MSRFKLLSREAMSQRQREVADTISSGPRGALKGPFLALIHNPDLAAHVQGLGEHLRFKTGLDPRLVEITVLLTARRWSCDYEWAAHARIAREAGLDAHIIDAIASDETPAALTTEQQLVYSFARQTVTSGSPEDAAFEAVAAAFGLAKALDLLALCGYYSLLAFVLNAAQLPLPEGAKPLAARQT